MISNRPRIAPRVALFRVVEVIVSPYPRSLRFFHRVLVSGPEQPRSFPEVLDKLRVREEKGNAVGETPRAEKRMEARGRLIEKISPFLFFSLLG